MIEGCPVKLRLYSWSAAERGGRYRLIRAACLFALGLVSVLPVWADTRADMTATAQRNGCFVCHAIDRKMLGPSWKEVADKFHGDKSAASKLATRIKSGSSGAWGPVPMPPNPQVSDADIKLLVKDILSLK